MRAIVIVLVASAAMAAAVLVVSRTDDATPSLEKRVEFLERDLASMRLKQMETFWYCVFLDPYGSGQRVQDGLFTTCYRDRDTCNQFTSAMTGGCVPMMSAWCGPDEKDLGVCYMSKARCETIASSNGGGHCSWKQAW